jgi:hypothetical protein
MKKTLTLIFITCLLAITVMAKENEKNEEQVPVKEVSILAGKVIDKITGEELAGVAVKLEGTNFVTYSDFEGNFSFNNINPGSYKLSVEFISYSTVETSNILVQENEVHELNIGLEQKK